ncbi:hypothetical protein V6N12_016822 [Hibiscus sabdariffa]|uniref:RNase H type-1 domain-containing protein n=1 Tax=Hibiscus sabdariffa TaxID=183260 RepID=A0ABR2BP87_9ROSI
MATSGSFGVCNAPFESIDHLFRWCYPAVSAWSILVKLECLSECLYLNIKGWFLFNLSPFELFVQHFQHWSLLFGDVIWNLWRDRNRFVFEPEYMDNESLIARSIILAQQMAATSVSQRLSGAVDTPLAVRTRGWTAPRFRWFKLNCDGSRLSDNGIATCGGVLRNYLGDWMLAILRC